MTAHKFTLCLSGGGFRATLFHLGVIAALRAKNELSQIKRITSASGGSIVAAHLVLNWNRYNGTDTEFREAVVEITDFIRADVRGRILRRWFLLGWLSRFTRTRQLIRYYDQLFKGKRLADLDGKGPELFITCASMSTGQLCWFNTNGLCRDCLSGPVENLAYVRMSFLSVATAVAASSAFPPMFPPVVLDPRKLPRLKDAFGGGERLTDGGVFDNLGLRAALKFDDNHSILVSDASAPFDQNSISNYRSIFGRTIRTTDILMSRIATLEKEGNSKSPIPIIRYVDISTTIKSDDTFLPEDLLRLQGINVQPIPIQELIKNVRTDFDAFSTDEIRLIYLHGYEVGLRNACDPSNQSAPAIGVTWDPSRPITIQAQLADALQEQLRYRLHPGEFNHADANLLHAIMEAENRRLHIWNSRDALCWIALAALCVPVALLWHYESEQLVPALRHFYISAMSSSPDNNALAHNCRNALVGQTGATKGYNAFSHAAEAFRALKIEQEQLIRMRQPGDDPSANIGQYRQKTAAADTVRQYIRGPVEKLLSRADRGESVLEPVIATCASLVDQGSSEPLPASQRCASAAVLVRDVGERLWRASTKFETLAAENRAAAISKMAEYPGLAASMAQPTYDAHLKFFDERFDDTDRAMDSLALKVVPLDEAVKTLKAACGIKAPGEP